MRQKVKVMLNVMPKELSKVNAYNYRDNMSIHVKLNLINQQTPVHICFAGISLIILLEHTVNIMLNQAPLAC